MIQAAVACRWALLLLACLPLTLLTSACATTESEGTSSGRENGVDPDDDEEEGEEGGREIPTDTGSTPPPERDAGSDATRDADADTDDSQTLEPSDADDATDTTPTDADTGTPPADTVTPTDVDATLPDADATAPDADVDTTPDVVIPPDTSGLTPCTVANSFTVCGGAGRCVQGFCCDRACGGACESCQVPGREGTCSPIPAGTVCRSSVAPCDAAEVCDGTRTDCPSDRVAAAGTVCREARSECDLAEQCNGATTACPADVSAPAGTLCGDRSTKECDLPDTCNGAGTCNPNPAPATTVCRPAAHSCDLPETCNGAGVCPVDALAPAGSACGDRTTTACSAPDTCTATGTCAPNHTEDGTTCGSGINEYRCDGTGCAARPQIRTSAGVCQAGSCAGSNFGPWTDLATCGPDSICVATASSATCATCNTPPAGFCEAGNAFNYTTPGTCVDTACTYSTSAEACASSCTVSGSRATCNACHPALMAIPGAPLWSWETGDEGWDMGGIWSRYTREGRTGSRSMGFYDSFTYAPNSNARTRWTASYNLTACAGCTFKLSFWVKGRTEAGFDDMEVQCSGNGGSNWTTLTPDIGGNYPNWTLFTRTLPSSCVTASTRLAFRFTSDSSVEYDGYIIDDLRLHATDIAPTGFLDGADPNSAAGWSCDGDSWSDELLIELRFFRLGSGTPIIRTTRASNVRSDLVTAGVCGGTGNHGYIFTYDDELRTLLGPGTHTVRAFAIDGPAPCGAGAYELSGSPRTFGL